MTPPRPPRVTEPDVRAALREMAAAARLAPFAAEASWHDVLFRPDGAGGDELAGPDRPDGALLDAVAAELAALTARFGGLADRARTSWLEDVLRVKRLPVVPDRVVAHVEADPKTAPAVLPRGTVLRGGKDHFGNERRYRTRDPLTAHGAALVGVRSLVPGGDPAGRPGLAGAAPDFPLSPHGASSPPAPHRMRIHSPALAFPGGDQDVELRFLGATGVAGLAGARWRWSPVEGPPPDGDAEAGVPAVVAGSVVRLRMSGGCGAPEGGDPWLECELPDHEGPPEDLGFTGLRVAVTRSGVAPDAGFYNDGSVDVTKEFQPFGAVAKRGDAFYLRCDEAFGKVVRTLTIRVTVLTGKTALDSAAGGSGVPNHLLEKIVEAALFLSDAGDAVQQARWGRIVEDVRDSSAPGVVWQRRASDGWEPLADPSDTLDSVSPASLPPNEALSQPFAPAGQPGRYVRAFLESGDFGWADYREKLAAFATAAVGGMDAEMPTPPVPPVVSAITIDYSTAEVEPTRVESLSGWRRALRPPTGVFRPFRRDVGEGLAGMVALGLDLPDSARGSSVSLWLDVDAAALCGDPDPGTTPEGPAAGGWQWWDGSAWHPLPVADASRRLREPGLLRFVAPADWATGCSDVDAAAGRWIRLATPRADQLGRVRGVVVDAVVADYVSGAPDPADDPTPATALPVGAIKGALTPVAGVKKVTNLASERGRGPEGDAEYGARASALVRHRRRAVTPWDYEQLVRVGVPEVRALRCLPHTDRSGGRAPGSVALVVVPDRPDERAPVPSVGLAERVVEVLAPAAPVGPSISVLCPLYAPVTVEAEILLGRGVAALSGLESITASLESALHPAGSSSGPVAWGRTLYASWLVSLLEGHPDVDAVTRFLLCDDEGNPTEQVDVDPCRGLTCSSGAHVLTCREQL